MKNSEYSLTKGNNSWRHGAIWTIIELEQDMVLNNVTKFHEIQIKSTQLRERLSLVLHTDRHTDGQGLTLNAPAIVMARA